MELVQEISALRREVAELKAMISAMVSPSASLSISEKSRLILEAHASGNRSLIRKTTKLINGGKR